MIEASPSAKPSARPHLVPGNSSPMIAVRSLAKKIGQQEILRGVDLEVRTGETLVIIGRSGGGKSVLLKHLVGLMEPDAGEIWIQGQNITGINERQFAAIRQKVGILFQGGALFDSMTVADNIAFPLREAGQRDPKVLRSKVAEMLEVMEMEGEEDKMPESLSGASSAIGTPLPGAPHVGQRTSHSPRSSWETGRVSGENGPQLGQAYRPSP